MEPIQVFVFLDTSFDKYNDENLYEMFLRAVPRDQYQRSIEEPQNDNTLLLDLNSGFTMDSYEKLNNFINRQQKPTCLVAHNGVRCDFQILKRELNRLNVSLSDDLLCADSLYAFYDILQEEHEIINDVSNKNVLLKFQDDQRIPYNGRPVRRIFFAGQRKPEISYELGKLYERIVKYPEIYAHPVENDVKMMILISHKLGERFLAWMDQIRQNFAELPDNI